MSAWDSLWTNARIATMARAGEDPYGARGGRRDRRGRRGH